MLYIMKGAVVALILAIGMSSTLDDVLYLWRRPATLFRSLVAMYVAVPAAALVMVKLFPLPWGTEVALVVLALCAGAPLLPKKLLKLGGEPTYAFSLVVATSVLALVTVPLGLRLLSGVLAFESSVGPMEIAFLVLESFLIPLGGGLLFHAVKPRLAERMGEALLHVGSVVLALCTLAILAARWRLLLGIEASTFLAFALFAMAALASGHLLGGPDPRERTSLAVACVSRHIGLAMLVAASYRGNPRTLALVLAYIVASAVVSIPYIRWRMKIRSHEVPGYA